MNKSNLKLEEVKKDDLYLTENKGISEPLEKDDILYQLYEKNFDKIEKISSIMKYTQILTYIFSFLFLFLLIIKFTSKGKFNWLYLSIPELLILLGLIIIVNSLLYLKYLIDKIENNSNSNNFGTIFTFIIINSIGICLSIFSIILMLRLDLKILVNDDLNLVMIPLYISLILALMFFIFIIPSLIFYISLFGHIFLRVFKFINSIMEKSKDNKLIKEIETILYLSAFILLFLTGLITQLKLDNKIRNTNHYIQGSLFFACFLLFSFENIKSLFFDDENFENND